MNGFRGNHYRPGAGAEHTMSDRRTQRSRLSGAACLLALAALAAILNLGRSTAHAQEAKSPAQVAKPAAGNAENGKKLFTSVGCYECHDREGQGGAGTGPRLAPNPLPLSAFIHQLRQSSGQMPPYTEKVLSDAQVTDIYAYLQTIPKPPPASSIPLLQGK
jgi:mono/diheme cytochrome c family protein